MEDKLLFLAINTALEAGKEVMRIYDRNFSIDFKEDKSPLTEADTASNHIICENLKHSFPIISEENKQTSFQTRKNWETFWLIDPLDGTKEFIKKNGQFTVNIALVKNQKPILGVVFLPAKNILYFSTSELGSYKAEQLSNKISDLDAVLKSALKLNDALPLPKIYTVVASLSHDNVETETYVNQIKLEHGEIELVNMGSSIKICLVAERKANIYPRLAPTMEWDTAAAHAIAKFSGCMVLDFNTKEELHYNKENLLNPNFIVYN